MTRLLIDIPLLLIGAFIMSLVWVDLFDDYVSVKTKQQTSTVDRFQCIGCGSSMAETDTLDYSDGTYRVVKIWVADNGELIMKEIPCSASAGNLIPQK